MSDWNSARLSGVVDRRKWLRLLTNPYYSTQLSGQDWLYGVIGATFGVVGFICWAWGVQWGFKRSVSIFGDLVFSSLVGSSPGLRFLWLAIVSVLALIASLAVIGNRMGARKRSWAETAASQGALQAAFGAGYLVNALLALLLWKLSILIMMALLLSNLAMQVTQAADLHEVAPANKFAFIAYSLGLYVAAAYIVAFLL